MIRGMSAVERPPFTEEDASAMSSYPGREEVHAFLVRKWEKELDYVLRKDLWTFAGNRIAVRFQYEWHDAAGGWWRSYGNENWEFADNGLMQRREASINDVSIAETDRRIDGPRAEGDGARIPLR